MFTENKTKHQCVDLSGFPSCPCSVTHHCYFMVTRGSSCLLERENDAERNVWFEKDERKEPGNGLRGKPPLLTKCIGLVLVLI